MSSVIILDAEERHTLLEVMLRLANTTAKGFDLISVRA
jgi:hypothetical protein